MDYPAHTIVTLYDKEQIYSTYIDWVREHAERYYNEYNNTSYCDYFDKQSDILIVLCSGMHSKENNTLPYLCRSLTTDKLVLTSARALTYNTFSEEIYTLCNASTLYKIFNILQSNLLDVDETELKVVAKAIFELKTDTIRRT